MPWEVHSCQRLINSAPYSERFIDDEFLSSRVKCGVVIEWPPFYRYNYDLESLWWILLWACLFCVSSDIDTEDSPCNLGLQIFTYTSQPSQDRTHVIQTPYSEEITERIPLKKLISYMHALHAFLYCSYATTPNDVDGYLEVIHQSFWRYLNMMQNCVSVIRRECEQTLARVRVSWT